MKFLEGSPCYCGSGENIERCCIDFSAKNTPRQQVRIRQKFRHLNDDEKIVFKAKIEGNKINLMDWDISDKDNKEIERCSEILDEKAELASFHELFYNEYMIVLKYKQDIEEGNLNSENNEINRIVVNFVSNTKLFVDFLESRIKKNYSDGYSKWKAIQSAFFDETFEYSLLYHLRNHVQHVGFPIYMINNRLVEVEGKETHKVDFYLSKTKLLQDKSLKSKVKDNLRNNEVEEDISFVPLVIAYSNMIEKLYLEALVLYIQKNTEELERIERYFKKKNLVGALYRYETNKINFIKGDAEGTKMFPIMSQDNIAKLYVDLSKLGIVKLHIKDTGN